MSGNAQPTENKTGWRFSLMTAHELERKEFAPLRFFVDDILPVGLAVLSAPAKSGKSWFALDLALSVAAGKPFLGFATHKCTTLYCGLEDSFRRLHDRAEKLWNGAALPDSCLLTTEAAAIDAGLSDEIRSVKKSFSDLGLVIIDLFKNVRSSDCFERNSYTRDYDEARRLKDVAVELDICILLVTHNRKMRDENDVFNNITGTVGLYAAVDVGMVLQKERASDRAELHINGKDVEAQTYRVEMNNCKWQRAGLTIEQEATQIQARFEADPVIKTVKALCAEHGGACTVYVSELLTEALKRYGECGTHNPHELKQFFKQSEVQLARMWIKCDTTMKNSNKGARIRFEPIKKQENNYEQGNLLQDLPGMQRQS